MSTPAAKALAEKKVKRQKQIIAVGSVVLLAVVGFQLPKLLGGGNDEASSTTTPPAATSTPGEGSAAGGSLPDTDHVVIQRGSDQLLSFGLFKSKDPFVQQLSSNPAVASSSALTTPSVPAIGPIGVATTPTPTNLPGVVIPGATPSPSSTAPGTTTPATTAPATPTSTTPAASAGVLIVTNGACETIAQNGTFPANENIFRLLSIAKDGKSAEIGVVGGSYDSGQATTTLKIGEKVTLVNTADGTKYVLELQSKCTAAQRAKAASAAKTTSAPTAQTATPPPVTNPTPTASPPPAAATTTTTTTATTPIVPDSLDTTTTTTN